MNVSVTNPLCDERHFFDIEKLTDEQYANLDIGMFIMANLRRYIGLISEQTGALSELELSELPGIFYDQGIKPLTNKHRSLLDESPLERKKGMLGYLKAIAKTRVVQAIYASRKSVDLEVVHDDDSCAILYNHTKRSKSSNSAYDFFKDSIDQSAGDSGYSSQEQYWHIIQTTQNSMSCDPAENLMFAAEEVALDEQPEYDADRYSVARESLESIRDVLPAGQYATLRDLVESDFSASAHDIARDKGCSVRKVYARLAKARRRMYDMLPPELQAKHADDLKRKSYR